MTTTSTTETLAAAEAKRSALRDRLEVAQTQLGALRSSIEKHRDAYRDQLALSQLGAAATPDRTTVDALLAQLPHAEDLVAALERELAKTDRALIAAQADVLDSRVKEIKAETRRRQDRINELQAQLDTQRREIERELAEHVAWIADRGPTLAVRLEKEARELRSQVR